MVPGASAPERVLGASAPGWAPASPARKTRCPAKTGNHPASRLRQQAETPPADYPSTSRPRSQPQPNQPPDHVPRDQPPDQAQPDQPPGVSPDQASTDQASVDQPPSARPPRNPAPPDQPLAGRPSRDH